MAVKFGNILFFQIKKVNVMVKICGYKYVTF